MQAPEQFRGLCCFTMASLFHNHQFLYKKCQVYVYQLHVLYTEACVGGHKNVIKYGITVGLCNKTTAQRIPRKPTWSGLKE